MPENTERKYRQVIDYVEDQVGADIDRDLLKIAIGDQDVGSIDVETEIRNALKSFDNDELISRIAGADGEEVEESALETDVDATDIALVTFLSRALNTVGEDELVSRQADSSGDQIDPATKSLEDALKSNDSDEFVSRVVGANGDEVAEEALDSSIEGGDIGLITYLARALNSQDLDEFVSRITDSSGTQIDPLNQDVLASVADDELRTNTRPGDLENLLSDTEFMATHRESDVADTDTAFTVVVSNPSDSDVDIFLQPMFSPGGLAHLDYSEDITVDDSGTDLDVLPKNVQSDSTPSATIEQGGSYTIDGDTLSTILPGTKRQGGPSATSGTASPATGGVVLNPGDSVLYEVTNQSGGEADYSMALEIVEK